jgi:tetratricopeptide (TPR) repeat protein
MGYRVRIFVVLGIAMALLVPVSVAQKPPAPTPPPPVNRPTIPSSSDPIQPREELVMFLRGRVAIRDGTPIPNDMLVERVCNNRVRQEVYASAQGDFSMQLGSRTDSVPETSDDPMSRYSAVRKDAGLGISRRELTNCELRASASGFHSRTISLMGLDTFSSNVDVGVIVMQRGTKIESTTLDAALYKLPKDARRAYEKGLQAKRDGKFAEARKYFETTVEIYPSFTKAWFLLGTVLQRENQKDAARKAYTQATTLDSRFVPPYLSLASMAFQTGNWTEVLHLTDHILDLDPLYHTAARGYVIDLDSLNYGDAYFYNAVANYKLNKFEEAEKSGLKAEHLDLQTNFPQLHLLLAEIFARKNNYALAIAEIQTYLALAPHARDTEHAREQLAKLEKLSGSSVN